MLVNSSEQDRFVGTEEALHLFAKNSPNLDLLKGLELKETSME